MEKELKVRTKLLTKEYSLAQTRIDKLKTLFSVFQNKVPTFWALKVLASTYILEKQLVLLV